MTRTAPETSAIAVTPLAGLISGAATAAAKQKPEHPIKSNAIPTVFMKDQISLLFLASAPDDQDRARNHGKRSDARRGADFRHSGRSGKNETRATDQKQYHSNGFHNGSDLLRVVMQQYPMLSVDWQDVSDECGS